MKQGKPWLLVLGALALGGGVLVWQLQNMGAAIGVQLAPTTAVAALPTTAQFESEEATPTAMDAKALLQTLETLTAQGNQILAKPGWVHWVERHDRAQDIAGVLRNGQAIPLDYTLETWYQVDKTGEVVGYVMTMLDAEGQTTQVAIFKNGEVRNLTFPDMPPTAQAPYPLQVDYGLVAMAKRSMALGGQLMETTIPGAEGTMGFVVRETYTQPVMMAGYAKPVLGSEQVLELEATTGLPLLMERVMLTEAGMELGDWAAVMTLQWAAAPPAEVLMVWEK